jgi:hypothetical protein
MKQSLQSSKLVYKIKTTAYYSDFRLKAVTAVTLV